MNNDSFHAINGFFEQYGQALENYDTKHLAMHYALPCSMLADDSASNFTEFSKLEGFFNQGANFYKQFGIAHARPEVWNKQAISGRIARVKVNWQYYDALNQPIYNCDYFYIVKLDRNEQWKIELSVSINEKQQMDEWLERKKG